MTSSSAVTTSRPRDNERMSRIRVFDLTIPDRDLPAVAEGLREIAAKVGRLNVSRHDPEKFFVQRDDLRADLEGIADQLEGQG